MAGQKKFQIRSKCIKKEEEQKWRVRDNYILKKSEFFPYVSISFSVFIEHLIPSAICDMYS